ncbi:hypothetical protein HY78_29860 (plasmid) [Rhizorhabdus wittichii DC-6]|nr:hypothetical protein HY78_29860 [Rhizorhabdus wittichii DC-6]
MDMDRVDQKPFEFAKGFEVNPAAAPNDFDAKAPYIDNGTGAFSADRYSSKEYMEKEWERVWTKVWLIAGPQSDLREPGDYFTFEVGRESFLVTMGEDGKINAFYNVCPHRGMQLVQNDAGSVNGGFTCPYHSWQFDLEGSLTNVYDRETFRPETICHNPGLTPVACEVACGLIFITMNENPTPLMEQLGDFGARMGVYEIDKMVTIRHTRAEIASNWKTGLDGFIEPYHFHAIHKQALPLIDDYHIQQDLYPNGVSRMIIKQLYPSHRLEEREKIGEEMRWAMNDAGIDPETYEGTSESVRQAAQLSKRAAAAELGRDYSGFTDTQITDSVTYSIFPNAGMGCHPEAIIMARFLPHESNPEIMYWDHITMYRPVRDDSGNFAVPGFMAVEPGTDLSGEILPEVRRFAMGDTLEMGLLFDQDAELLPSQQRGVRSRGFKGPLFGEQELRCRHYHAELDRYMAD